MEIENTNNTNALNHSDTAAEQHNEARYINFAAMTFSVSMGIAVPFDAVLRKIVDIEPTDSYSSMQLAVFILASCGTVALIERAIDKYQSSEGSSPTL